MAAMPDLGKQVGPMPLGAWIAVVGGSLGFMIYTRSRGSKSEAEPAVLDPGVGYGGVGAVGAYVPTDGGAVNTPAASAGTIESNDQWSRQAFAFLVGNGADGATVDKALRDYLSGITLSLQNNSLITQALAKFGQPPETLPDAPTLPVAPRPLPPRPAPKPPIGRVHLVLPGENLSRIANKYYGKPDWSRIFNANRDKIRNPNVIFPGQRLVIP